MQSPALTYPFQYCTVELYPDEQLVVTRFSDGTEAHACPHDTPEYHAHALDKTGRDDIMLYCWQHDLMHVMIGEMNDRPSAVLWAVAHELPTDTDACVQEEREAMTLQRLFNVRG
jgi:hypothetical protein